MAEIGSLQVRIGADTSGLDKGVKDTQSSLNRISAAAKPVVQAYARVGAAAAAAGAALVAFAQRGISAADETIKTARTLGMATSQLEALRFAAQQSGVSVGALDSAMTSFVRRLGEAEQGTGQAAVALQRLGLDARHLASLPTDQAMKEVADALQGVEGASNRAQIAYQIFGRQGVQLTRMLEGGSEALAVFERESARFGVTLTQTQVRNVENATDAQGRLSTSVRGLSMQLGATLAPAFARGADAAANFVARMTEAVPRITAVTTSIFGLQRELDTLTIRDIEEEMRVLEQEALRLAEAYAIVENRSRTLRDGTETQQRQLDRTREAIVQNQEAYEQLGKRLAELKREGDEQTVDRRAQVEELTQIDVDHLQTRMELFDREREMENEALAARLDRFREFLMDSEELQQHRFNQRLEELREFLDADLITHDQYYQKLQQLAAQHEASMKRVRDRGAKDAETTSEDLGNRLFDQAKQFAIGRSVLNAYRGISETLANYPWPIAGALAAAHGAVAFRQVAAIRSSSPKSGGGTPSVGAGASASAIASQAPAQAAGPTQTLQVSGISPGDIFTGQAVRELASRLLEFQQDGGRVVFAD